MVDPLDIIKRLDIRQNVTIRVLDEFTHEVIQEHVGHNAATNSLLTGIAHYLMGDGVLNQATDMLSSWIPRYISLGTMGLSSQASDENGLPIGIGYTPVAPDSATSEEIELNAKLRFDEYINQGITNINELSKKFGVSSAAVRYRAYKLKYISEY